MCVRKRENKQDREGKSEKVSHTEGEGRVRMREGWGREIMCSRDQENDRERERALDQTL